jgi:D-3-phosphoglycerate dehydrogenase / 2-oxoglutarate reductase
MLALRMGISVDPEGVSHPALSPEGRGTGQECADPEPIGRGSRAPAPVPSRFRGQGRAEVDMRILATGPSGPSEELDPLRAAGHEVAIGRPLDIPGRRAYTEAELVEEARDAHVILASHLESIGISVFQAAPRLGLVIVPFIGVDKIDVQAASRLGVLVANSPTAENFIAVAEATIGLMVMLLKRIKHNEARLRRGQWAEREDRGDFLFGKTVGLVGLGRIGSHVARRLAGWDVRLLAADPYVPVDRAVALGVTLVDLRTVLAEAAVVSLHANLTGETRGMIGEKELQAMKPAAILINTARGELVDEDAVARAIEERWIAGGAIDAFAREPLPLDSALRRVDPERLVLTPHNVSHSDAGWRANLRLALDQILAAGRGEPPRHTVNPEAIPRWRHAHA